MQRFLRPKEYVSFSLSFGEEKRREERNSESDEHNFGMNLVELNEVFSVIDNGVKMGPFSVHEKEEISGLGKCWETKISGSYYNGQLHGLVKDITKYFFFGTEKRETTETLCVYECGKEISRKKNRRVWEAEF